MPVNNEITLKPFRQTPGFCGQACIKMLVDHYDVGVSSEQGIAEISLATRETGTSLKGIIRAANYFNLQVFVKDSSKIADLRYFIDRGIPIIVNWFQEDDGHYSIAVGLDEEKIVIIDPGDDHHRKEMAINLFLGIWFDYVGDYPYRKNSFILRRMIALTPFGESFPIKGGKILAKAPKPQNGEKRRFNGLLKLP
ncbi:MAG: cysteine peptidase family C39 domain-containing protein [Patescibacteria group bacterium]